MLALSRTLPRRERLHAYIDALDEVKLRALPPLPEMPVDEFEAVIETDLTAKEIACIEKGVAEYREHPENFVALDDIIAQKYPNGMPPAICHLRYADTPAKPARVSRQRHIAVSQETASIATGKKERCRAKKGR
ncbi:MAG: hypothetical protein LBP75_02540 [Planctomycetota bacterium]|jgi:hypothetical protein|nr:hypothetical protein [Planctomycetota bacterium]